MPRTPRSVIRVSLLLAAVLLALALVPACGDDDDDDGLTAPQSGAIAISTTPTLAAPWSLAGPDAFADQGTGAAELTDLVPGDYTITWGAVDGYVTPSPQTGAVVAGEVRSFVGAYVEASLGALMVTTLPDTLPGPWSITGPAGYQHGGVGSAVITDLEPGPYEVTWERLPLWLAPASLQMDVSAGDTTEFLGEYGEITGMFPDWVMWIFEDSHDVGSIDAWAGVLGEDFQFVPTDGSAAYGYDTEVQTMGRLFGGEAGSNGMSIAGVHVVQLEPQGVWQETPQDDPHFGGYTGSQYRTYLVQLDFAVAGQNLFLRVQGPATFYVKPESSVPGAEWELLGIVDATYGGKAVESHSWTEVKALFF